MTAITELELVRLGDDEILDRADLRVLTTADGFNLRTATFSPDGEAVGTFLLLHGYTEFIEKYHEVIANLIDRQFSVVTFDWRGQGLSDRVLTEGDIRRGYLDDFSVYVDDADFVYQTLVKHLPGPHYLLGHSMGGHMSIRILQERPYRFEKAVLSAPMVGFESKLPLPTIASTSWGMVRVGKGAEYAPEGMDFDPENPVNMVTSDEDRWQRALAYWRKEPRLVTHGVTWQWLLEASKSMQLVKRKDRLARLVTPTLLASAGNDLIVSSPAQVELADGCYAIKLARFPTAMHEILMETDDIQFDFWQRFDGFLAAD
jgi:lysophospholipase